MYAHDYTALQNLHLAAVYNPTIYGYARVEDLESLQTHDAVYARDWLVKHRGMTQTAAYKAVIACFPIVKALHTSPLGSGEKCAWRDEGYVVGVLGLESIVDGCLEAEREAGRLSYRIALAHFFGVEQMQAERWADRKWVEEVHGEWMWCDSDVELLQKWHADHDFREEYLRAVSDETIPTDDFPVSMFYLEGDEG